MVLGGIDRHQTAPYSSLGLSSGLYRFMSFIEGTTQLFESEWLL